MKSNPFTPRLEDLPSVLPIFPLPRAILLPGAQLPLNIFEPRYLSMTFDALGANRLIGMIQPDPGTRGVSEAVYGTGCAGRITAFNETEDGRLLVILTGVCRFDVLEELPLQRGYRRVRPDWRRFEEDLSEGGVSGVDAAGLLRSVRDYLETQEVEADWDALARMPGELLVNYLAMNLPFDEEEKQALVEARTPADRQRILLSLCAMSGPARDPVKKVWH